MIENKFAYFDSIADMYADGVSANAENTKVFDSDHQITGIDGTPKIPYETICFIKKPNVTFTHGRFYGLPYPIELKQLVFKTTADKMTAISLGNNVNALQCPTAVSLEIGEKMRFTVEDANFSANGNLKLALMTTVNGTSRIINICESEGTKKISVRYENASWWDTINVSCVMNSYAYDKGADKSKCNVYAYKTKKIGVPKPQKKTDNVVKVAVHRRVSYYAHIGTVYFFENAPVIPNQGSYWLHNQEVEGVEGPSILTITQKMVEYKYDSKMRKKWAPALVFSEITSDVFDAPDNSKRYEPISPYFEIVPKTSSVTLKVICTKKIADIEKCDNLSALIDCGSDYPDFHVQYWRTTKAFGTKTKTRGSWKSVYHKSSYFIQDQKGEEIEIVPYQLKGCVQNACRFRFVALARRKYRSVYFTYAKRIKGSLRGLEDRIVQV